MLTGACSQGNIAWVLRSASCSVSPGVIVGSWKAEGTTDEHEAGATKTIAALANAVRLLNIALAIVAVGWAGGVAMAFTRRVWAGEPIGIDLLTSACH